MRFVIAIALMLGGCTAAGKVADYGCKAACFTCNTMCPLVRDVMNDASSGDEDAAEEDAPVPEPPPASTGPTS